MNITETAIGNDFKDKSAIAAEQKARQDRDNHNRQDKGGEGHDVKSNPNLPPHGKEGTPQGPMGEVSSFTQLLESLAAVTAGLDVYASADNLDMDTPLVDAPSNQGTDDELLEALNQIFTPILITQSIEGNISEQVMEACSEDNVLMERNIIRFDDASRMSQLTSVCALLIARQKGSQEYKMFKEAATIRNKMKLQIQKAEFEAAQTLAQKYLVKVSTSNNSSVARQAAQNLLPVTQH